MKSLVSLHVPPQKVFFFENPVFIPCSTPKLVPFQGSRLSVPTGIRLLTATNPHTTQREREQALSSPFQARIMGKKRLLRKGFTPDTARNWDLGCETPFSPPDPPEDPLKLNLGCEAGWGGLSPVWGQQLHNKQSPGSSCELIKRLKIKPSSQELQTKEMKTTRPAG